MNYIKSLKVENTDLKDQLNKTRENLIDFINFLNGPKFTGCEWVNGRETPKNWINVSDAILKLQEIKNSINIP